MRSTVPHVFQGWSGSRYGRPVRARVSTMPWGLAGMLLLVLGVELFVTRHKLDLTGLLPWECRTHRGNHQGAADARARPRAGARCGSLAYVAAT